MKKPTATACVAISEGFSVWELEDMEEHLELSWVRACKAYGDNYAIGEDDHGFSRWMVTSARNANCAFRGEYCWDAGTAEGDRESDEAEGLGYTPDQAFSVKLEIALWPALPLVAL